MKPGEIITKQNSDINLNDERQSITLKVSNSGDRPIQVGSHYHFAETNEYLKFDREKSNGMRFCLLYTSPSPRDSMTSRMPSSA